MSVVDAAITLAEMERLVHANICVDAGVSKATSLNPVAECTRSWLDSDVLETQEEQSEPTEVAGNGGAWRPGGGEPETYSSDDEGGPTAIYVGIDDLAPWQGEDPNEALPVQAATYPYVNFIPGVQNETDDGSFLAKAATHPYVNHILGVQNETDDGSVKDFDDKTAQDECSLISAAAQDVALEEAEANVERGEEVIAQTEPSTDGEGVT